MARTRDSSWFPFLCEGTVDSFRLRFQLRCSRSILRKFSPRPDYQSEIFDELCVLDSSSPRIATQTTALTYTPTFSTSSGRFRTSSAISGFKAAAISTPTAGISMGSPSIRLSVKHFEFRINFEEANRLMLIAPRQAVSFCR